MTREQQVESLIQGHKVLEQFDYSLAVEWAVNLISQGKESDNVFMLASFSKPYDSQEISSYVDAVMADFGLKEYTLKEATIADIHIRMVRILSDESKRENLKYLRQLCIDNGHSFGLQNFYLLYYAWGDLDANQENHYYDGANLQNIEGLLKVDAEKWIDKYINGNEPMKSFFNYLRNFFR